jgi:predicted secreted hydrolase
MWRIVVLAALALIVAALGLSLVNVGQGNAVEANAVLSSSPVNTADFARAFEPRDWQFPRDFGPQVDYQTEWWYYTGNVSTADGRRFGYQFTIFRRGITPGVGEADSEWRTNQFYMAHFTVSDIQNQRFYHEERFSRGGAALAGATADPQYRVWLENWQVQALNADATETQITAATDTFAVDLILDQLKPPALQGDEGLSAKSEEPGNASHYYSLTRLATQGTITVGGEAFTIEGYTWKDHEFSTSALGANALGWDWFGLQFDDNRELMIGQIRLTDGGRDPYFGGLLSYPDGTTRYLNAEDFSIEATSTWTSPHTGAIYPASWVMQVDIGEAEPLNFSVTPQFADQELHGGGIAYYEGSVRIEGDVTGWGYAELTGYVDAMTGRF